MAVLTLYPAAILKTNDCQGPEREGREARGSPAELYQWSGCPGRESKSSSDGCRGQGNKSSNDGVERAMGHRYNGAQAATWSTMQCSLALSLSLPPSLFSLSFFLQGDLTLRQPINDAECLRVRARVARGLETSNGPLQRWVALLNVACILKSLLFEVGSSYRSGVGR